MSIRLAVLALLCSTASAQPQDVLAQLAGREVAEAPPALSIDLYPAILAGGGFGGTVGYERGHWHVGIAAFAVEPPAFIEDTFFRDTDGVTLTDNRAVEVFVRYYPRADRRWLYAELISGPDRFEVTEDASGLSERFVTTYLATKVGVRVLPIGDYLSIDAAIGYAFNLGDTSDRTLGDAVYRTSSGGVLPFIQIGTRIPVGS